MASAIAIAKDRYAVVIAVCAYGRPVVNVPIRWLPHVHQIPQVLREARALAVAEARVVEGGAVARGCPYTALRALLDGAGGCRTLDAFHRYDAGDTASLVG